MRDGVSTQFPNIAKWLERYLKKLSTLPSAEYVVLRYELDNVGEYQHRLDLLDSHLGTAGVQCSNFGQLIGELRGFGTNVDGANGMLLDKLAEIRAVVGLAEFGFDDIKFSRTPDLTATKDGNELAIEVTRIAASGGIRELSGDYEIQLIAEGDEDVLSLQLVTKAVAKRAQLLRANLTATNHILWISTGRDYFLAGRYEPKSAGLRKRMPNHLRQLVEKASVDDRITRDYPELVCLVASPGADAEPTLVRVAH